MKDDQRFTVEECDATAVAQRTNAWPQKNENKFSSSYLIFVTNHFL
jgi:hypothetical protein